MLVMASLMCVCGVVIRYTGEKIAALSWKPSTSHGSARFASEAEVSVNNLFGGRGFLLGHFAGNLLRFSREGHILTFAPTQSVMSVGGVIPNLIDHPGSCVVIDVKGENYAVTSRERAKRRAVYALAPLAKGIEPASFNPLDFIRPAPCMRRRTPRLLRT